MSELLGCHLIMARTAQASDVDVIIRAAVRKRHDMIRHGCGGHAATLSTTSAERLSFEPSTALSLPSATSETFDPGSFPHHQPANCSGVAFNVLMGCRRTIPDRDKPN